MLVRSLSALGGAALIALPLLALSYPTGAPPNFDGFSNDCSACHGTFPVNSGSGAVEITAPDAFIVGEPVEITVTVTNTTDPDPNGAGLVQGFEAGVRDGDGNPVGTFDIGTATDVQFAQGDSRYVTHTEVGNQQSSWTFNWIPPANKTGDAVTIYVAGNAANGNGSLTLDYIYTAQKSMVVGLAGEEGADEGGIALGTVSPQPVRSRARATLSLREPGQVTARLVDGRGRTVREILSEGRPAGESEISIDARGLSAGVYFVVIDSPAGRRTGRVVVAR